MTSFESPVKTIPAAIETVFDTLSDFSNLERLRDKIPEDKVQNFSCDSDNCRFTISPAGNIAVRIVEREPYKTIKLETVESPVPFFIWVQLLPTPEGNTALKLTLRAELNPFIRGMISKPLQEGVNKLAETIAFLDMAQKLWEKNVKVDASIDLFTVGRDREMDLYLARYDILGSIAHITMLESIGLLTREELDKLTQELRNIYAIAEKGDFLIEDGVEDVHSQVELMLTRSLGDIGKKIHSGRSRNDQVLVDLKLFIRSELQSVVELTDNLFTTLIAQSEKYKNVLMPGYTHLQVAMPSSFGLWFGAYAESLVDDLTVLQAAYRVSNRNPLGSAAGYGSSFPLDRSLTTRLLGFDSMNYNVVYAQMGRGKTERIVASALASIAATLSKVAFDACLFNSQNFGFIKLPDAYTTGSSIMPHKKNPDVFELTRAKCNKIQALPYQITLIANNLPSGYFRDLQIIKEVFLPAFDELKNCLRMVEQMMSRITVNEHILDDCRYDPIFSVEEVNRLTLEGTPFRDAYKQVGLRIEAGDFTPNKDVHHTHEGSIGNLCNEQISSLEKSIVQDFDFGKTQAAFDSLLGR